MAGRGNGKKKKTTITVYDAKFHLLAPDFNRGAAIFEVQKFVDSSYVGDPYKVKLGMISCWVDPSTNNCIKAHLVVHKESSSQLAFMRQIEEQGEVPVSSSASGLSSMTLMGERGIIRYGNRATSDFHHRGSVDNEYRSYYTYDSKALAIMKLIDHLKTRKTIGGLSLVNFSMIPDDVLVGVGYEPIQDRMIDKQTGKPCGIAMWKGNPEEVVNAGSDTGGYRYGRTWEREKTNAESFLQLLQSTIKQEKVA